MDIIVIGVIFILLLILVIGINAIRKKYDESIRDLGSKQFDTQMELKNIRGGLKDLQNSRNELSITLKNIKGHLNEMNYDLKEYVDKIDMNIREEFKQKYVSEFKFKKFDFEFTKFQKEFTNLMKTFEVQVDKYEKEKTAEPVQENSDYVVQYIDGGKLHAKQCYHPALIEHFIKTFNVSIPTGEEFIEWYKTASDEILFISDYKI